MSDLERIGENKLSGTLAQPFNKESVKRIMVVYRDEWKGKWSAYGTVEFENRDTKGEQRFEGENFDEVVAKIKAFLTHEL